MTPLATSFPFPPVLLNDAAAEKGGRAVFVTEMGPGRAVMRDPNTFLWPTDSPQAEAIPTGARIYRITLDGTVTDLITPTRKILITNGVTQAKKNGHLLAVDFFHGSVVDVDIKKDARASSPPDRSAAPTASSRPRTAPSSSPASTTAASGAWTATARTW